MTFWTQAMPFFSTLTAFHSMTFPTTARHYSAVIREFEIIGEAVGKLPNEIKQKHPDVEWQNIKDFGVDLEIVWRVIPDDLPGLLQSTNKIIDA